MSGPMDKDELQALVQSAAEEGTKKAFMSMGLNTEDAIETQKDMAFLRGQRTATEQMGRTIRTAVLITLVTGGIGLLWVGFQFAVHKPPAP